MQTISEGHLKGLKEGRTNFTNNMHFRRTVMQTTFIISASILRKNNTATNIKCPQFHLEQHRYFSCETHVKLVSYETFLKTTWKKNRAHFASSTHKNIFQGASQHLEDFQPLFLLLHLFSEE